MKTKIINLILSFFIFSKGLLLAQEKTILSEFRTEINKEKTKEIRLSQSFSRDTIFYPFGKTSLLTSVFVNGEANLYATNSLVRITIEDTRGIEYMIFEANYLTDGLSKIELEDEFEETGVLDSITPYSINLQIINAKLNISSIIYTSGFRDKNKKIRNSKSDLIKAKKEQKVEKVKKGFLRLI